VFSTDYVVILLRLLSLFGVYWEGTVNEKKKIGDKVWGTILGLIRRKSNKS
jgi:hypothetical protein